MAKLPVLFKIQEIYNRQGKLRKSISEAEQNPDLIKLKTGKTEYRKKLDAIAKKHEIIRKRQQQLDLELKSCLDKIGQEETKLYGGSVVNPRELEQIQQKAAEYAGIKARIEEELLNLMEDEEKFAKLKDQINQADQVLDGKLATIEAQVKQIIFESRLELEELDFELTQLIASVSEEWLAKLDKIAVSHNGVGIAQIKSDCCGACHVSLSDFLLQKAKRGEDQILLCENCGRIIYY